MKREYGNPEEPHLIRTLREKREKREAEERLREVARNNAVFGYQFLQFHGARVTVEVGGTLFEAVGTELPDMIARANAHIRDLKKLDDAERSQRASLTWGT